jgi:hypothetical protein
MNGKPGMFSDHCRLGRLKNAVQPQQHDHRQHDKSVLRRTIGAAQAISDFPDFSGNDFVVIGEQIKNPFERDLCLTERR